MLPKVSAVSRHLVWCEKIQYQSTQPAITRLKLIFENKIKKVWNIYKVIDAPTSIVNFHSRHLPTKS